MGTYDSGCDDLRKLLVVVVGVTGDHGEPSSGAYHATVWTVEWFKIVGDSRALAD